MTGALPGLLLGALAGFVLGSAFFAGLWLTIGRARRSARPWAWFAGSFALRLLVVGGGLLLLAQRGPWPLVGSLAGFLAARPLVTRLLLGGDDRPPTGEDLPAAGSGSR